MIILLQIYFTIFSYFLTILLKSKFCKKNSFADICEILTDAVIRQIVCGVILLTFAAVNLQKIAENLIIFS
uniref:Uncharacterized protein n=1 Tax=Lutzomyia longipalpis TaxID=7200 RepID=A0A7G3B850_LUTLO